MDIWVYALMGFVAVAGLMPFAAKLAIAIGFVDTPGERKVHDTPIPPIGGLLILPVFLILYALTYVDWSRDWSLYVGALSLLLLGAVDDRIGLNAWLRFGVQIAVAAIVVIWGEARLDNLGFLFTDDNLFELGPWAVPFSIAAVALLVNAINLMDGLDGLAGGQSFLIFALIAGVAVLSGSHSWAWEMALILAPLAGFLVHNMRSPICAKARVFLGDAGTLALGLCLAWFAISAANDVSLNLEPISVAWFLVVPIMDECAQFYRRVREGRHPFSADRGHFHHHFLDAGYGAGQATVRILFIALILGAFGYFALDLQWLPQGVVTLLWVAALLGHMFISAHRQGFYARLFKR